MKISFETQGTSWGKGQKIQGEVVESKGSGSTVLVNGIRIATDKNLPLGKKISGTIENSDGSKATIALTPESTMEIEASSPERWLSMQKFDSTPENQALIEVLQKFHIPLTPEVFRKALALFKELGIEMKNLDPKAFGLLLLRNLPKEMYSLLRKYFQGELKFKDVFQALSESEKTSIRAEWNVGKAFEKLISILDSEGKAENPLKEKFSEDFVKNLFLQENLSSPPQPDKEGRLYFQWPLFWKGEDSPDTLEGEAFYGKGESGETGFSLRVLIHPPRLGPLQIGIHRLKEALWVHFETETDPETSPIKGIFPPLNEALQNLGWRNIRLTIGGKSNRPDFLSPTPVDIVSTAASAKVDIKI